MVRILPLSAPYPDYAQAFFDAVLPLGTTPPMLFRILAKSERAWLKQMGASLMDGSLLHVRTREIVILRTTALNVCEYEWSLHIDRFSEVASLGHEHIVATLSGSADSSCWSETERHLITAVDALHFRAGMNASEFGNLAKCFDEAQIFEIIQLAGYYRTISCLAHSFDLGPEPGMPRFADYPPEAEPSANSGSLS